MDLQRTGEMFVYVSEQVVAAKDLLTRMDKAIGDGDHGIGMAKGFGAVREAVEGRDFADLAGLFKAAGLAFMASAGGASGAIFGTLFQGAAPKLADRRTFDAQALAVFLGEGLAAVRKRGKAEVGQKTMVDALAPAAKAAESQTAGTLPEAAQAAAEAARLGMEKTKEMTATLGRARYLGERALGHPDPGAVSTHLILESMAEFIARENG